MTGTSRAAVAVASAVALAFGSLALVAPASADDGSGETGPQTLVGADGPVGAPTGSIVIRKGGTRQADGSVSGLAGATFQAQQGGTAVGDPCTTDATGSCTITGLADGTYTVVETGVAAPWLMLPQLSTGSGQGNGDATDYVFSARIADGGSVTLPSSTRTWANAAANPEWPGFCGLNVALLLDTSGSIDRETEWPQMKAAAAGFVTALTGTPSQVSVWSFSSEANGQATAGLQPVKSDDQAAAVISTIDGVPKVNGSTNWDEGLAQIAFDEKPQNLDAVLVLTDGNPTISRASGNGSDVILQNVEQAVHSANAVKAMASTPRVIGVGIGISGDAALNLAAISGPNVDGEDPSYYTTDFASLGSTLRSIAASQCAGSVTVEKQVTQADEGPGTPANGWQFGFGVTPDDGRSTVTNSGVTGTVNKAEGVVQYQVTGGSWPKDVVITEVLQQDATLLSATCTINPGTDTVVDQSRQTEFTNEGSVVTVTGLQEQESVTCTFLNKVPTPPPPPPPGCTNCTPTPDPTPTTDPTPEPTPTPEATVSAAEQPDVVTAAEPATVTAVAPAMVTAPAAATIPEAVPAGDGASADGSSEAGALGLLALVSIGLMVVTGRRLAERRQQ